MEDGIVRKKPGLVFDLDISGKTAVIYLAGVLYRVTLAQSLHNDLLCPRPNLSTKQPVTEPEALLRYSRRVFEALISHTSTPANAKS